MIPAEPTQLGDAQAVAVGDPDHGGIAVPVPVVTRSRDQALDFLGGQALAGAALSVGEPTAAALSHFEGLTWSLALLRLIARTV